MLPRPDNHFSEPNGVGRRAGGHVWVIEPHHADGAVSGLCIQPGSFQFGDNGQVAGFLPEGIRQDFTTGEAGRRGIGGVPGIRHQGTIAGVEVGQGEEATPFLAAHQWDNALGRQVDIEYIGQVFTEASGKVGHAAVGLVSKGAFPGHVAGDGLLNAGVGREVGAAHAEVDHVMSSCDEATDFRQLVGEVVVGGTRSAAGDVDAVHDRLERSRRYMPSRFSRSACAPKERMPASSWSASSASRSMTNSYS